MGALDDLPEIPLRLHPHRQQDHKDHRPDHGEQNDA
tara:strand:- start:1177 stop:1284 length:108 start_codon:yes stop_codon:yes gene_type:complete